MARMILSLVSLIFVTPVFAADFGLEVGFRQQSASIDSETSSVKSQSGYQLGAVGIFPVSGSWGVRSGLMYVNRPIAIQDDATGDQSKISLNYFEVPVALSYKFEDYASVFGGVAVSMHLDSNASSGYRVRNEKTPFVPMIVGASFKAAPQWGGTLFFESGSGEAAEGLKNYRAVGASLAVFFD